MKLSKIFAAVLCPAIISLLISLFTFTPMTARLPNVSYQPFWQTFFIGFLILFAIHLCIAIPLSSLIDVLVIRHLGSKPSFVRGFAMFLGYGLGGATGGALFGLFVGVGNIVNIAAACTLGGILFLCMQTLWGWIFGPFAKKRNPFEP